jgi:hypothetical protein
MIHVHIVCVDFLFNAENLCQNISELKVPISLDQFL